MSDASPVTMRDLDNLERLMLSKFADAEKATIIFNTALNLRMEGLNRAREEIKDNTALLVTRAEYEARREHVDGKVDDLMAFKNELKGKASQNSVILVATGTAISIAVGLISLFK